MTPSPAAALLPELRAARAVADKIRRHGVPMRQCSPYGHLDTDDESDAMALWAYAQKEFGS